MKYDTTTYALWTTIAMLRDLHEEYLKQQELDNYMQWLKDREERIPKEQENNELFANIDEVNRLMNERLEASRMLEIRRENIRISQENAVWRPLQHLFASDEDLLIPDPNINSCWDTDTDTETDCPTTVELMSDEDEDNHMWGENEELNKLYEGI